MPNSVRDLLGRHVAAAPLPLADKDSIRAKIRALAGRAVDKLADKLLDWGADKAAKNVDRLQGLLAHLPGV